MAIAAAVRATFITLLATGSSLRVIDGRICLEYLTQLECYRAPLCEQPYQQFRCQTTAFI